MTDTLFDDSRPLLELPAPAQRLPRVVRPPDDEWEKVSALVFERDGLVCQRCLRICKTGKNATSGKATCDHVIPLSRGGWTDPLNLQTLCFRCNRHKGERVVDYRADPALRLGLELEREIRDPQPGMSRGGIMKGSEKLAVTMTVRVTETEAAALRARYGTNVAALRAGLDRLLYG